MLTCALVFVAPVFEECVLHIHVRIRSHVPLPTAFLVPVRLSSTGRHPDAAVYMPVFRLLFSNFKHDFFKSNSDGGTPTSRLKYIDSNPRDGQLSVFLSCNGLRAPMLIAPGNAPPTTSRGFESEKFEARIRARVRDEVG